MPLYEFTFIAQQGLTQYEVEGLIKELFSLLSKSSADVIKHEYWGLRDLAYAIEKMNKVHYCMMYINAMPKVMDEFKRKVDLNEDIVRYLCIRRSKVDEGDSFMMQAS